MTDTSHHDARIAQMTFASIYPLYIAKVVKKGRSEDELRKVISWLTGMDDSRIDVHIAAKTTFAEFFSAARIHPNAPLIRGLICGYRVEEITNTLTQKVRYLDKLVDELAQGRPLTKILR